MKHRTLQYGGNSVRSEQKRNLYNNVLKTLTGKELRLWKTGDQEFVGGADGVESCLVADNGIRGAGECYVNDRGQQVPSKRL